MNLSIIAAVAVLGTAASAQIQTQGNPVHQTVSAQDLAAQAAQLAAAIRAQIGNRVSTANAADLEAFIVFAVDQSGFSDDVALAALDILSPAATGNLATAIENARKAIKARRRGTGTVLNNQGGLGTGNGEAGDGFSAPGVGTGGGTVNYTG